MFYVFINTDHRKRQKIPSIAKYQHDWGLEYNGVALKDE